MQYGGIANGTEESKKINENRVKMRGEFANKKTRNTSDDAAGGLILHGRATKATKKARKLRRDVVECKDDRESATPAIKQKKMWIEIEKKKKYEKKSCTSQEKGGKRERAKSGTRMRFSRELAILFSV